MEEANRKLSAKEFVEDSNTTWNAIQNLSYRQLVQAKSKFESTPITTEEMRLLVNNAIRMIDLRMKMVAPAKELAERFIKTYDLRTVNKAIITTHVTIYNIVLLFSSAMEPSIHYILNNFPKSATKKTTKQFFDRIEGCNYIIDDCKHEVDFDVTWGFFMQYKEKHKANIYSPLFLYSMKDILDKTRKKSKRMLITKAKRYISTLRKEDEKNGITKEYKEIDPRLVSELMFISIMSMSIYTMVSDHFKKLSELYKQVDIPMLSSWDIRKFEQLNVAANNLITEEFESISARKRCPIEKDCEEAVKLFEKEYLINDEHTIKLKEDAISQTQWYWISFVICQVVWETLHGRKLSEEYKIQYQIYVGQEHTSWMQFMKDIHHICRYVKLDEDADEDDQFADIMEVFNEKWETKKLPGIQRFVLGMTDAFNNIEEMQ